MHDKDEKIFNVKMHLKEYSEGVDQIHLGQVRDQWGRAVGNTVMILWVPWKAGSLVHGYS